jgi:cobalt/nickel transport system permease protein
MHMADALVSPAVGGTMWLVAGSLLAVCSRRVRALRDDRLVPLMGVMGAFVFTAQMINFSIPGTGSSGHLGGGLLLAILLGPHAAFLVIASVLVVQALFFADGGLLALGCNIVNLGCFPAFVAYPWIYRPIAGKHSHGGRAAAAAILAAMVGLQLGALAVVLETVCSGISSLPFGKFVLLMQPIHLAIGVVEGLATAGIVGFLAHARPEALLTCGTPATERRTLRPVLLGMLAAAALLGGGVSWLASTHPDGLEWTVARVTGSAELPAPASHTHTTAAQLQETTSVLPDYNFPQAGNKAATAHTGKSLAGLTGGAIVLGLAVLLGFVLRRKSRGPSTANGDY